MSVDVWNDLMNKRGFQSVKLFNLYEVSANIFSLFHNILLQQNISYLHLSVFQSEFENAMWPWSFRFGFLHLFKLTTSKCFQSFKKQSHLNNKCYFQTTSEFAELNEPFYSAAAALELPGWASSSQVRRWWAICLRSWRNTSALCGTADILHTRNFWHESRN